MANLNYDEAVVEFLARPENIEHVFTIWEQFEKIRDSLHLKFWRTVHAMIQDQIPSGWQLHVDPDADLLEKPWTGVLLHHLASRQDRYLCLGLQQERYDGSSLYSGLYWSKEVPDGHDPMTFADNIPQVATLRSILANEYSEPPQPAWLCWKWVDKEIRLRDKPMCIRLARSNELEITIVDDFMRLCRCTYQLIEAANQEITAAIHQGRLPS
jgi:hypothetical protein